MPAVLKFLGVTVIVLGFLGGVFFLFAAYAGGAAGALWLVFASVICGSVLIGFGRVIELLERIAPPDANPADTVDGTRDAADTLQDAPPVSAGRAADTQAPKQANRWVD